MSDRDELAEQGRALRESLFGQSTAADLIPDSQAITDELDFGLLRSRSGLPLTEKLLIGITATSLLERTVAFESLVRAALHAGISARSVLEVVVQTSLYSGFILIDIMAPHAHRVFREEGATVDDEALPVGTVEEVHRTAAALMEELHGRRKTMAYANPENAFTSQIYRIGAGYGYGILWQRPGLTLRERMVVALASMTAMGATGSIATTLRKFSMSAVENCGFTVDEVAEVTIQAVPYCGFWVSNQAMTVLEEVFPGGQSPQARG